MSDGPLKGVRIVDMTRHVAGPFCTMILGDMGAEVIKIEPPGVGSPERAATPVYRGMSTYFMGSNRSKKSVVLNLKTPDGVSILKKLSETADVFVENMRPGVCDRLGVGYEDISKVNRQIVYCSISGYGHDGPFSRRPSYDLVAQALGGLLSLYSDGRAPPIAPLGLADLTTAMVATQAILAALFARERQHVGQFVEASLLESAAFLLQYMAIPVLQGMDSNFDHLTRARQVGFMGVYSDASNRFFVIEAPDDGVFQRAASIPELKGIVTDPKFSTRPARASNWQELHQALQGVLSRKPREYWVRELEKADVPCAAVKTVAEALQDPQLIHRGGIVEFQDEVIGKLKMLNLPMKFSETTARVTRRPPLLGEQTEEVLGALGYTRGELLTLRDKGVIA